MRRGYSISLGEEVSAEEVDYGDCKDFQIVCPSCREAVFKGGGTEHRRHYLSHHAASKSDAADCERRVASIARRETEQAKAEARGQRLRVFQSVFRRLMLSSANPVSHAEVGAFLGDVADRMVARPGHREFVRTVRGALRMAAADAYDWTGHVLEAHFADRNPFWKRRQGEFARDMLAHLIAPTSFRSFAFGLSVAVAAVQITASTAVAGVDADAQRRAAAAAEALRPFLHALAYGSDREVRRALVMAMRERGPTAARHTNGWRRGRPTHLWRAF